MSGANGGFLPPPPPGGDMLPIAFNQGCVIRMIPETIPHRHSWAWLTAGGYTCYSCGARP